MSLWFYGLSIHQDAYGFRSLWLYGKEPARAHDSLFIPEIEIIDLILFLEDMVVGAHDIEGST